MDRLVWLSSFPKSGNTWVRALLTALTRPTGEPLNVNALQGGAPLMDLDVFEDIIGLRWSELSVEDQIALLPQFTTELAQETKGKSYRKTHMSYGHAPSGKPFVSHAAGAVAVYIVRDPRQVAVSCARFFGTDIQTAIDQMNDPDRKIQHGRDFLTEHTGRWGDHVMGWTTQTALPVHIVKYEHLLAHPQAGATDLAAFLGLGVSAKTIATACAQTSFAHLQSLEAAEGFNGRSRASGPFFRTGTSDEWRNVLTMQQRRQIERDHACAMEHLCYS